MYYVAYDMYHNVTVVSNTVLGIRENETILVFDGDIPDSNHIWNKETLKFERIPKIILTKFEYMKRFNDDELAKIYTLAKSNIQLEIWLEKFKTASEVDLTDLTTCSGVRALETAGIIAAGRAEEILKG